MRPSLLDRYFTPLEKLKGLGPRTAPLFDRLLGRGDGARVVDLLFHKPTGLIDRARYHSLAAAPLEGVITVALTVAAHRPPARQQARAPWRVLMEDETGDLTLVFFHGHGGHLEKQLPVGARRIVSGTVEMFDGLRQMVHPDFLVPEPEAARIPRIEPVYPLTQGVTGRRIASVMDTALAAVPDLPEWRRDAHGPLRALAQGWPGFRAALIALHHPETAADLEPAAPALRRLAFDELLASQIALVSARRRARGRGGRATTGDGRLVTTIRSALPYALTGAQSRALDAIFSDMASENRMIRLLQGDVGAGKTIVALLAMARAVEAGRQAALMAPTEILALQHAERLAALAAPAGLRIGVLTGRTKGAERAALLADLASGTLPIVVGTHALFQGDVLFADLALAVVDEQHRFGVHQRLALGAKGEAVDLLVMTATPIPRTLALTAFGDMDIVALDEKPPGRKLVDTRLVPVERIGDVVAGLKRAVAEGARVYWVCPLVAENETLELAAAEARFEDLAKHFPGKVGLVHGKLRDGEKDAAIRAFQTGAIDILVATTVVEVGVDVPEASIMVIEHAERFGLAQLHQLRGRVGRGQARATCLLLYRGPLGAVAESRLKIMRETEDGFRIAEEDLRLRGEGEVVGTRQSGAVAFRIARLDAHADLLRLARHEAESLLDADADLSRPENAPLKLLLHLFDRDDAVRLLEAG